MDSLGDKIVCNYTLLYMVDNYPQQYAKATDASGNEIQQLVVNFIEWLLKIVLENS